MRSPGCACRRVRRPWVGLTVDRGLRHGGFAVPEIEADDLSSRVAPARGPRPRFGTVEASAGATGPTTTSAVVGSVVRTASATTAVAGFLPALVEARSRARTDRAISFWYPLQLVGKRIQILARAEIELHAPQQVARWPCAPAEWAGAANTPVQSPARRSRTCSRPLRRPPAARRTRRSPASIRGIVPPRARHDAARGDPAGQGLRFEQLDDGERPRLIWLGVTDEDIRRHTASVPDQKVYRSWASGQPARIHSTTRGLHRDPGQSPSPAPV